ncbi:hypothetical protein B0O99DRAFT_559584, partial [Bisporella sp. PMI_857]
MVTKNESRLDLRMQRNTGRGAKIKAPERPTPYGRELGGLLRSSKPKRKSDLQSFTSSPSKPSRKRHEKSREYVEAGKVGKKPGRSGSDNDPSAKRPDNKHRARGGTRQGTTFKGNLLPNPSGTRPPRYPRSRIPRSDSISGHYREGGTPSYCLNATNESPRTRWH